MAQTPNEQIDQIKRKGTPSKLLRDEPGLIRRIIEDVADNWDEVSSDNREYIIKGFFSNSVLERFVSKKVISKFTETEWGYAAEAFCDIGRRGATLSILVKACFEHTRDSNLILTLLENIQRTSPSNFKNLIVELLIQSKIVALKALVYNAIITDRFRFDIFFYENRLSRVFVDLDNDAVWLWLADTCNEGKREELSVISVMCSNERFADMLSKENIDNSALYKVTKNEKFLPDAVKKIFLRKMDKK